MEESNKKPASSYSYTYEGFVKNILAHSYEDKKFAVTSYNVKKGDFDQYQSTHRIRLENMQCKFNLAEKNNFIYLYMKSMDSRYKGTDADHFTIGSVKGVNDVISIHSTQYNFGIEKKPVALYCIIDMSNPDTFLEPDKPAQCMNNNVDIVRTYKYINLTTEISTEIISRLRAFIRIGANREDPKKSKPSLATSIPTPVVRKTLIQPSKSVAVESTPSQLRALRDSLRKELLNKGGGGTSPLDKSMPKRIQVFSNEKSKTITLVFELPEDKVFVRTINFRDL